MPASGLGPDDDIRQRHQSLANCARRKSRAALVGRAVSYKLKERGMRHACGASFFLARPLLCTSLSCSPSAAHPFFARPLEDFSLLRGEKSSGSREYFTFHVERRMFHVAKRTFHVERRIFHVVKHKIAPIAGTFSPWAQKHFPLGVGTFSPPYHVRRAFRHPLPPFRQKPRSG